jgi:hypothetical protein
LQLATPAKGVLLIESLICIAVLFLVVHSAKRIVCLRTSSPSLGVYRERAEFLSPRKWSSRASSFLIRFEHITLRRIDRYFFLSSTCIIIDGRRGCWAGVSSCCIPSCAKNCYYH